jgi:L,D-transpeptidase catalytic domain
MHNFIEVRGKTVLIIHDDASTLHALWSDPIMSRLSQFCVLATALAALSSCSTVSEMVTSNLPEKHSGRPSIVVSLRAQEAYLYRGKNRTASSRISSGREGYRTPVGRFQVIRKDEDHRSSVYGDYVDASGKIVKANVDIRRDRKPPHSHFVGAPMPYYLEFSPGYGLHQGYLPGEPASHGCIRMPYWKARQFYYAAHIGTPVVVRR